MADDNFLSSEFPKMELDAELGVKVELNVENNSEFDCKLPIISVEKAENQEKISEVVVIPSQNHSFDINQLLRLKAVPIVSIAVNKTKTEPEENQTRVVKNAETTKNLKENPAIQCRKCENRTAISNLLFHVDCTDVVCPICHRRFSDWKNYYEHALFHSDHKAFECHLCFKCFKTDTSLRQHCLQSHCLKKISKKSNLTCPVCKRQFDYPLDYYTHFSSIHCDFKPFQCPVCLCSYPSRGTLRFHVINIHLKSNCVRSTTEQTNKKRQFLRYKDPRTGDERFRCNTCFKVLYNKKEVNSHSQCHYRLKARKCNRCNRHFQNTPMLWKHIQMVHKKTLAEKTFICDDCDQIFYSRVAINHHVIRHKSVTTRLSKPTKHLFARYKTSTGIECYRCSTCYRLFETIKQATIHQRYYNRTTFGCRKCDLQFSKREAYSKHVYLAHRNRTRQKQSYVKRIHICDDCDRIFYHRSNFTRHTMSHIKPNKVAHVSRFRKHAFIVERTSKYMQCYKCSTCNKVFETRRKARKHQGHYNRLIFGCKPCNLRFSNGVDLRRHYYRIHILEQRSYICDDCGKRFFRKLVLSTHVSRSCLPPVRVYKLWDDRAAWALPATVNAGFETSLATASIQRERA